MRTTDCQGETRACILSLHKVAVLLFVMSCTSTKEASKPEQTLMDSSSPQQQSDSSVPKEISPLLPTIQDAALSAPPSQPPIDGVACEPAKTKIIAQLLGALSVAGKRNLLVVGPGSKNIYIAGRNVKNLDVKPLSEINAYDVINNENIIFDGEKLIGKIAEAVAS